ncbi:MAG: flagellar M-ring protein FliF [Myxococcota bacterium]|jgi:flagellar M-ring protein FliF|nr:flagellar M-ring protein FliF [Myxococcota bacterium]
MAEPNKLTGNEKVDKAIADVREFVVKLPMRIRIAMAIVAALIVVVIAFLTTVDRTENAVLFSGLSSQDAAAIVEQLKDEKVPFKLGADGTSVLVPSEKVHELRLKMAAAGLPMGGGVGFELFDQQRFGMTEFEERVSLRRALEGELSRTISKINVVKGARVHLVMPKRSVLGANSSPAQASVVLELRGGREMSEGTVGSIIHLVSSAVEGLSPDQVTVVDTHGRLLSSESGFGLNARESEHRQKFERDLEHKLREMLDQTLGVGRTVVRVAGEFDFSKRESTEEHYDPERSVIRSEQRELETSGSAANGGGGVPGTRSNLPGGQTPETTSGSSGKKREMETRNYEVDKVVSRTVGPSAELKRLSVTVLVDGKEMPAGTKATPEDPTIPRTKEELRNIEMAVKGAIAFDDQRGDRIEVRAMPFAIPESIEQQSHIFDDDWWKKWVPIGVLALAVLTAIAVLLLTTKRTRRSRMIGPVDSLALPKQVGELQAIIEQPDLKSLTPEQAEAKQLEAMATAQLMGQVRQFFMEESEAASRVLRSWLSDARQGRGGLGAKGEAEPVSKSRETV